MRATDPSASCGWHLMSAAPSMIAGSVHDLAQIDTIEAQQPGELSLAQQLPAVGFGGQEAETKRHRAFETQVA